MALIGEKLELPEFGWRRYNDADEKITYKNVNPLKSDVEEYYNKDAHFTLDSDNETSFKFYGTKIRIIGDARNEFRSNDITITIDGDEYTFSELLGTSWIKQALVYEKTELEKKVYTVSIIAKNLASNRSFIIDAIDIDEDGHICELDDSCSHTGNNTSNQKASTYQLPMNTTKNILSKTNDKREGLLGMANDPDNYGDLYVVGKDGRSHLTKSGMKSEVIFEGKASETIEYLLSNKLSGFKSVLVEYAEDWLHTPQKRSILSTTIIVNPDDFNISDKYSITIGTRLISFNFKDEKTLKIDKINIVNECTSYISKIVGVY